MKTVIKILSVVFAIVIISSCKKEGTGGSATIQGYVKHHSKHIPGATVYIKYGVQESPGTDISKYDANTPASMTDGQYKFEGLMKGNYYLYAIGYDSAIAMPVYGGVPLQIKRSERNNVIEANVAVVE